MRVIVLGGAGNFGGRIVRGLQHDSNIDLMSAGRHPASAPGAPSVPSVRLDIAASDFDASLRALSPDLVIHCVGPFQGQDYRVAKAALGARSHYLDLADGRNFVAEFKRNVHEAAIAADRVAVSGASTLPALSSAVLEELSSGLSNVESIELVIAPGQRAIRGTATLESVLSYLGKPFPVWRGGRWAKAWGWMDLRVVDLDVGRRLAAACDVPDLALLPTRFPGVRSVRFHAALEFGVQHLTLWCLAAVRRVGLAVPVGRWAQWLDRWAAAFDPIAGDKGGMAVTITGNHTDGRRVRRTWQLVAPAADGPEIPCMAAILLTRRLAAGSSLSSGAFACMGLLRLADFEPQFTQWRITTRTAETAA
jgi:saccharopine dehydrogenase-like NADP-dependent oxidoreductase